MTKEQLREVIGEFSMDGRTIGAAQADALTEYLWSWLPKPNKSKFDQLLEIPPQLRDDIRWLVDNYVRDSSHQADGIRYRVLGAKWGSDLHLTWLRVAEYFGKRTRI